MWSEWLTSAINHQGTQSGPFGIHANPVHARNAADLEGTADRGSYKTRGTGTSPLPFSTFPSSTRWPPTAYIHSIVILIARRELQGLDHITVANTIY